MNDVNKQLIQVLPAQWSAPSHIRAFTTLTIGGYSQENYAHSVLQPLHQGYGLNLATHVDDDLEHVYKNRQLLYKYIESFQNYPVDALSMPSIFIIWLQQVHGTYCANLSQHNYFSNQYTSLEQPVNIGNMSIEADASFSSSKHIACAVLTADCLPLVVTNKQGTAIAAIHAGWKGLLKGIIENTIDYFIQQTNTKNEDILVWMGPAISAQAFEVGDGVMHAFMQAALPHEQKQTQLCFQHIHGYEHNLQNTSKPDFTRSKINVPIQNEQKLHTSLYANLYALARIRLQRWHVLPNNITGGDFCTYFDQRFYSYRRQAITGRMATIIHFV
jgi:polyphenol oxidase